MYQSMTKDRTITVNYNRKCKDPKIRKAFINSCSRRSSKWLSLSKFPSKDVIILY